MDSEKYRNNKENVNNVMKPIGSDNIRNNNSSAIILSKPTSLGTLVTWNISKALEKNPNLDIKHALTSTQCHIEQLSGGEEVQAMLSEHPCQRHLVCALLAWQELGHRDAESLFHFVESRLQEQKRTAKCKSILENMEPTHSSKEFSTKFAKTMQGSMSDCYPIGPVLKLPVETKIVMRVENVHNSAKQFPSSTPVQTPPSFKSKEKDIMSKIDQVCCLESVCVKRLQEIDAATNDLQTRVVLLGRREAERVELLERAEAAWKDLELGYQRRLSLAEEKEEDITRQIIKFTEDHASIKDECTTLAQQLKEKTDKAEIDRTKLQQAEKEICALAVTRLKHSEEATKGDGMVAEQQCRAAQLDRDLQFKEEQLRRKVSNLESEIESARTLSLEVERALHAELTALKGQVEKVSNQLLKGADDNDQIKAALEDLRQKKMELIEGLESCKVSCASRIQGQIDELKNKRTQLRELKEKEIECRCKLPVDETIEVKRTPSLAALCKCNPAEKKSDSCSCTSIRGTLLSNLLADLFSGLQDEMGESISHMPCLLLKCLEDKHNWDRSSTVKTNLNNYFSKLLVGELDIAIATSIEKYHAKWVGPSCVDAAKMSSKLGEDQCKKCQQLNIEKEAQKLASELAEQLFQNKANELTQRAREIVSAGPQPCDCKPPKSGTQPTLYPCLLKTKPGGTRPPPSYWLQTFQDVTHIRMQIEDLKKASVKKEDLRIMENKFTKIIQRAAGGTSVRPDNLISGYVNDSYNREQKVNRVVNRSGIQSIDSKKPITRKKCVESTIPIKKPAKPGFFLNIGAEKSTRPDRKTPTYSVNVCLCTTPKEQHVKTEKTKSDNNTWKQNIVKDGVSRMSSSLRQSKPINDSLPSRDDTILNDDRKGSEHQTCPSNCVCFHKIPSNTSIDKLLETLAKWKCDLDASFDKQTPLKACCMLNKTNHGCILDDKQSLDTQKIGKYTITDDAKKAKDKSIDNIEIKPIIKQEHYLLDSEIKDNKIALEQSTVNTNSSKIFDKSGNINFPSVAAPITATESEYMGAVNLEKSADDYCKCEKKIKTEVDGPENTPNVFKCINSSKCNCDKSLENRRVQNKSSRIKKEQYLDANTIHIKKDREVKDDVLNNMTKSKHVTQDNQINSYFTLNDSKITSKKSEPYECDCQIKFLGVTLSNANPLKTREIYLDTRIENDNIINKKDLSVNHIKVSGESRAHNQEILNDQYMSCINDLTKWSRCIKVSAKDVDDHQEVFKSSLKNDTCKIDKSKSSGYSKQYHNQVLINVKSENYEQNTENDNQAEISESKNSAKNFNDITVNSTEKNITNEKKVLNDTKLVENKSGTLKRSESINDNRKLHKEINSCHCNARFDEFKTFVNAMCAKEGSKDIALDIQSFMDHKPDDSCVCCNKLQVNADESSDLEKNVFHLLEEYLKKKLDEFKQSSFDSTCIPPEEEHKLFTTTLERIKILINNSTNQIACKCSDNQQITQGSWNRAYGLLQEYLKIKIAKVQCSCILAEDNRDSILPAVLEKICELIEYDFQRLKDVREFKNDSNKQGSAIQSSDQTKEEPERDSTEMTNCHKNCATTYICPQINYDKLINTVIMDNTANHRKDTTSQVSSEFGLLTKSCSAMKLHSISLQTIMNKPFSVHSVNTYKNYRYIPNISIPKKNTSPVSKYPIREKNTAASDVMQQKTRPWKSKRRDGDNNIDNQHFNVTLKYQGSLNSSIGNKTGADDDIFRKPINVQKVSYLVNSRAIEKKSIMSKEKQSSCDIDYVNPKIMRNNKTNMASVSKGISKASTISHSAQKIPSQHKGRTSKSYSDIENETNNESTTVNKFDFPSKRKLVSNGPYIGYTVDCSCEASLGACFCSKSTARSGNDKINNIWKKSIPDETYFNKVSYIMNPGGKNTLNYNPDLSDAVGDLKGILKNKPIKTKLSYERETEISLNDEDFVLKKSIENFQKSNTMTGTYDDISINTECSNSEDTPDWCDCCSNTNPTKNLDCEQLKDSILNFPAPLTEINDNNNYKEEYVSRSSPSNIFDVSTKHCDCDVVPICHVKMLVENIESKLATAKCTCDSLIPQVCPEHSTNC